MLTTVLVYLVLENQKENKETRLGKKVKKEIRRKREKLNGKKDFLLFFLFFRPRMIIARWIHNLSGKWRQFVTWWILT